MSISTTVVIAGMLFGSAATVSEQALEASASVPSEVRKIGVLATHYNLGNSRRIEASYCDLIAERYPDVECIGLRTVGSDEAHNDPQYYNQMATSLGLSHLMTVTFDKVYVRRQPVRGKAMYSEHRDSNVLLNSSANCARSSVVYQVALIDMQQGVILSSQDVRRTWDDYGMRIYAKGLAEQINAQVVEPRLGLVQH